MNESTNTETINAYCDTCSNTETDTTENLKSEGWGLFTDCQFCPCCND